AATGGARLGGRPFPVLCGGCDPGIERSGPVPVLVPRPAAPPPCRPRPSRPELPPRRVLSTGHRLPEGFRLGDDEARPFAVDGQLDAFQASGQPKLGDRPPSLPPVGRAEDEVVTVDDGFHRPAAGASFQGGT